MEVSNYYFVDVTIKSKNIGKVIKQVFNDKEIINNLRTKAWKSCQKITCLMYSLISTMSIPYELPCDSQWHTLASNALAKLTGQYC